jgi:outer membrane protein OmpA-like peptidoglycan-associated protein
VECRQKEIALQRRSDSHRAPAAVPPVVHQALHSPGRPLDPPTRAFFEPRFGHDFSKVRVHADALAAESARAVGALAYTLGPDVVFGAGQYAPTTDAGRSLIAHELTHVVQQRGLAPPEAVPPLQVQDVADDREHEASATAARVMEDALGVPRIGADRRQLRRQAAPNLPLVGGITGDPLTDSLAASITLDGFASDSAELTAEHRDRLASYEKQVAGLLKTYPDSFISIVGHTDATDTEQHNEKLGQDRADAVLAALASGAPAVPSQIMRASSMGERSLKVPTQAREPRNRRVEVFFTARRFVNLPPPQPTPNLGGGTGFGGLQPAPGIGPGPGPAPGPSPYFRPIPPLNLPKSEWLKDALQKDSIIRSLPKTVRDKAVDALKNADELIAEKIIDSLPLEDKAKAALKAIVKTLLEEAKGKVFQPPTPQPPQYQQPPSNVPPMPPVPRETIIKSPSFPLPF